MNDLYADQVAILLIGAIVIVWLIVLSEKGRS